MDDLDLLTKLRAEVPLAAPSPRAEQLFRAGLAEIQSSERTRSSRRAARRFSGLRGRWDSWPHAPPSRSGWPPRSRPGSSSRCSRRGSGPPPSRLPRPAGKAMSVQLLADLAAKAVQSESGPSVRPGQWVYREVHVLPAPPADRRHVDDRRRH